MIKQVRRAFGWDTEVAEAQEVSSVPDPVDEVQRNPFTDIQLLSGHTDIVRKLLRVDESRFVSASDDSTLIVWNFRTGKRLRILRGHTLPVTAVMLLSLEQDNTLIVSAGSDKTIRIWNIDKGECVQVSKEHSGSVKCLLNLSNNLFASGGKDVCLWNKHGQLLSKYPREPEEEFSDIHSMIRIRDERIVCASSSKDLEVYSLDGFVSNASNPNNAKLAFYNVLCSHRESVRALLSVTDQVFLSASLDGGIVQWTTRTLAPVRTLNNQKNYMDSDHVYTYSVQHMAAIDDRHVVATMGNGFTVYDVLTGECLAKCPNGHRSTASQVILLQDGFISCSTDSTIRLWGRESFENNEDANMQSFFITLPHRGTAVTKSMKPVCYGELIGHSDAVHALLPCNEHIFASCGADGLVILWKNGFIESRRRNELAKIMMLRHKQLPEGSEQPLQDLNAE